MQSKIAFLATRSSSLLFFLAEFDTQTANPYGKGSIVSPALSLQVTAWCERADRFHQLCGQVNEMYTRLTAIPNRTLLYDVYQYVWDAKETTMLLDSYIAWLGRPVDKKFW